MFYEMGARFSMTHLHSRNYFIESCYDSQGRVQDFQIEGAQKIMCTPCTSRARSMKSITAGVQARLRALEALEFQIFFHGIWALFLSILI